MENVVRKSAALGEAGNCRPAGERIAGGRLARRLVAVLLLAVLPAAGQEKRPGPEAPKASRDAKPVDPESKPEAPAAPGSRVTIESLSGSVSHSLKDLAWELRSVGERPALTVGAKIIPLDEILFLKFSSPSRDGGDIELELQEGDRIRVSIVRGGDDALGVRHPAWGDEDEIVEVKLEHLAYLIVPGALRDDSELADFREKELAEASVGDKLFLRTGDNLEGILEAVETGGIRFSRESLGEILYPYEKVKAVRLAQLEDDGGTGAESEATEGITAAVHLGDGSVLSGVVEKIGDRALELSHRTLGTLDLGTGYLLQVAFRGGRCQFLSDLEAKTVKEHLGPLFTLKLPHRKDRSVMGSPMRMGGQVYAKGLGVHAYSLLEYDLEGKYQRFQSTVGIDDSARPKEESDEGARGGVVFRVYLDGKKLIEAPLSYGDAPRFLDLTVTGGKTLGLEVDSGNLYLPDLDRANWAEARIIK